MTWDSFRSVLIRISCLGSRSSLSGQSAGSFEENQDFSGNSRFFKINKVFRENQAFSRISLSGLVQGHARRDGSRG